MGPPQRGESRVLLATIVRALVQGVMYWRREKENQAPRFGLLLMVSRRIDLPPTSAELHVSRCPALLTLYQTKTF